MENSLPLWYNVHTEKHKAIPHNFRKAPQLSLCGVALNYFRRNFIVLIAAAAPSDTAFAT